MPGRRQQTPRTIRSMDTPLWAALYRLSMTSWLDREFILAIIRAGRPAAACSASRIISFCSDRLILVGATIKAFQL
ncbi:hypothetical protein D3C80_1977260 [compost metagenome]